MAVDDEGHYHVLHHVIYRTFKEFFFNPDDSLLILSASMPLKTFLGYKQAADRECLETAIHQKPPPHVP
jgi:hypothetical protein